MLQQVRLAPVAPLQAIEISKGIGLRMLLATGE
jgi:hypothetical protein